jgi:hypothetical protein
MKFEVESFPKEVQCHECRSTDIHALCHHCGRLLCKSHAVVGAGSEGGSDPTTEFTDLALDRDDDLPIHCKECAHDVQPASWRNVGIAGGVVVVGLLVLLAGAEGVGIGITFLGIAGVGWAWRRRAAQDEAFRSSRPPLPIFSLRQISLRETFDTEISLDADGAYDTTVSDVRGSLIASVTIGDQHRTAIEAFEEKYGRPPSRMHAGFLVLKSESSPHIENRRSGSSQVFPLVDDVENVSALTSSDADPTWAERLRYTAELPEFIAESPIRVFPSFVPDVDRQGIDLDVHWSLPELASGSWYMKVKRVKSLEVHYPLRWGELRTPRLQTVSATAEMSADDREEDIRATPVIGKSVSTDESRFTVKWKDFEVDWARALRATLIFRTPISNSSQPVLSQETITGTMEVVLGGAVSRTTSTYYDALGMKATAFDETRETTIRVHFELNLGTMQYEDRVTIQSPSDLTADCVPAEDRSNGEDKATDRIYDGTPPNAKTVTALSDRLSRSDGDYYVKSVVEEPPQRSGVEGVNNRLWNLHGRWYDGVWPVDFHISLMGEERAASGVDEATGRTKIQLKAKGAYTTPEMRCKIEDAWLDLRDRIDDVMREQDTGVSLDATAKRSDGTSAEDSSGTVNDASDSIPLMPSSPPSPRRMDEATIRSKVEELKDQRDQIRKRLIDGTMTQTVYDNLKQQIDDRIDELQNS